MIALYVSGLCWSFLMAVATVRVRRLKTALRELKGDARDYVAGKSDSFDMIDSIHRAEIVLGDREDESHLHR